MLKAIHAQEDKTAAKEKAKSVISRLREMKLNKAADKLENGLEGTLNLFGFSFWALCVYTLLSCYSVSR